MNRIISIILIFLSLSSTAQVNLDSLWNVWNDHSQADTARLKAIGSISWHGYVFSNADSAFYFAQFYYDLAKSTDNKGHMADALNTQGTVFYLKSDYYGALDYFKKSLKLRIEIDNKIGMAGSYTNIGVIYNILGNSKKALEYYKKGLKAQEELGYNLGIASSYNNIGILYNEQENYQMSLEYFFKGLEKFKKINNKQGIAKSYSNIGDVYSIQKMYEKALEYHIYSLKIDQEIDNNNGIADSYSNIGRVYFDQSNYERALNYYHKSVKIAKESGNKNQMAKSNYGISKIYFEKSSNKKALIYAEKSLQLSKKINALELVDNSSKLLYEIYKKTGNDKKALQMYEVYIAARDTLIKEEGKEELMEMEIQNKYELKKQTDSIKHISDRLLEKAELKANREELKKEKLIDIGLIIFSVVILVFLLLLNNRFKNTKKQKIIIEKQKIEVEIQKKTLEDKNKMLKRFSIVVSETENVILILDAKGNVEWVNDSFVKLNNLTMEELIAERGKNITTISNNDKMGEILETCKSSKNPYLYDSLNFTNEGKRVWESSTITPIFDKNGTLSNYIIIDTDITKQKDAEELVSQKNQDITDSINYAKRIQAAILPANQQIIDSFKESFILYLPKDIVAGDFYWLEKTKDTTLFAVADCTGHGVPGAMVSVICNNGLNRSVREYNITQPSKILDKTREIVIQEFAKSKEDIQDGMDIALCSIKGNKLNFSGAHNPLIVIRNKEVIQIKADRQPIGSYIKPEDFTNHSIDIQKDDMIYIFTDGFADQFGGEKGKKYRLKNLLTLLINISTKPLKEQHTILKEEFSSWKGSQDQIDDVCIMGVRV